MNKANGAMRRKVLTGGLAGGLTLGGLSLGGLTLGSRPARAADAPETPTLRLGLPVPAVTFLPIYIAMDRTFKQAGLSIKIVTFRGDGEVAQALAGGSVDLCCQSLDGLISLIKSAQPVIGFYAGFNQADFAWYATPSIKKWEDLKGKNVGVTTYGSLTDQLTRHALRKHGLKDDTDVTLLQAGPAAARLQAMKAKRLDAAILSAPHTMLAQAAGLTKLGTQAGEISKEWPKHIYLASKSFIDKNPNTLKAFLRAHVEAVRLAKADPAYAQGIIGKELKYEPAVAKQAYDEAIAGFNERGELPKTDMQAFWDFVVEAGTLPKAWTNDQLLDRRFIDTFDSWAPAQQGA
jgi:NitT/TauT family transport system substrate-binding protein